MSRQILFIHSAGPQGPHEGSSDFIASLRDALGAEYSILSPIMPHPASPAYEPWKEKLTAVLAGLHGEIIVIGHSLGGSVLLKYLSEESHHAAIAGLFLVATPYWGSDEDWQAEEFILQDGFASKLAGIPRIMLYHSDDDEIVPINHSLLYAEELPNAALRTLHGRGHSFNTGLPELVDDIRGLCRS